MRTDKQRPVTMPERNRMRALRAEGLTYRAIGILVGRTPTCVHVHASDVASPRTPRAAAEARVRRLTRMERFIASCKRAVAEARP